MPVLVANNASSRLAAGIGADDTQLSLTAGTGVAFPTPAAGEWFPVTVLRSDGSLEILRATERSGDMLTVVRAQEGTAALAFSAGDRIELRMTAAVMNEKFDKSGGNISGNVTLTADLTTWRPSSPGTGVVFLGNSGSRYLHYDGSNYIMPGANLYVNGSAVWTAGNFNPGAYLPLTGGTLTGNPTIQNATPQINFYDVDWGWRYLHCNGGSIGFLTSGGGWACYSDNSGNFIATANIGAYSDRKHKKRIRPIKNALALVERLRGVRYVRKRDNTPCVGVIAQEVQEVVPEVVLQTADGLGVDYGNLVGVLIPAVQELAARLRKLEGA